ncbi:SAM domain (Sterile alpha motif) [Phytophthora infestans]|uniref:SAM domain (Sterile alpha motif) n=1 Tax=Phytophthora infestans TaxID=4787 RepID=A0A833TN89_PHYIN|nr:SAM domain (Sterile alpha motif) [Phytophthora infestans]KAF4144684.1 SAM domain (Sterile alpha motif) [Phytophthora infestans]
MLSQLEDLGVSKEEVSCGRLEAGSPRDTLAWTPLQYACALGDTELVSQIIATSPQAVNALGNTKYAYSPLHIAVRFEHEAIVKLLLAASPAAKINAVDSQVGCSPLHLATLQGNHAIVKLLLNDFNIQQLQSKRGTTPVEIAEELEFYDVRAALVDYATRAAGRTQLSSWLASIGLVEYAQSFFDEGFDDATFLLATGDLDDKTLDAMHIKKAGHRAKLQKLYQLKEFLHVESEADDLDEESDSSEGSGEESESESESGSSSDSS